MKKYLYFIVNLQLIDTPGVTLTDQSEIYDAVTMQWSSSVGRSQKKRVLILVSWLQYRPPQAQSVCIHCVLSES